MKEKYIHRIGISKSDFHISDFLKDQILATHPHLLRFNHGRPAPPMKLSDSRMKKELQSLHIISLAKRDLSHNFEFEF